MKRNGFLNKKNGLKGKNGLKSDDSFLKVKKRMRESKGIKQFSESNRQRNDKYRVLKDEYKLQHPYCEICGKRKATSLHHKAGRLGENLFKYFMALCWNCHRFIHDNPKWAMKEGYLLRVDGERYTVEEIEEVNEKRRESLVET